MTGGATGTRQDAIVGGDVDNETQHVFRIVVRSGGGHSTCSSTLIAPNLLLTARHCVAQMEQSSVLCDATEFFDLLPPTELLFSNETDPSLESRWFRAQEVLVINHDVNVCGNDIALVILQEAVPWTVAYPVPPRFEPQVLPGEWYTAVGYGTTRTDGRAAGVGIRRSRQDLSVSCVGREECGGQVQDTEFRVAEGVCGGDSGGPAVDSEGRVIGLLSRAGEDCTDPIYTNVLSFGSWLRRGALRAAEFGGTELAEWAGGPEWPDPSSVLELANTEKGQTRDVKEPPTEQLEESGALPTEQQCGLIRGGNSPSSTWLWGPLLFCSSLLLRRRGR